MNKRFENLSADMGKDFSLFGLAWKNVKTYAWMNVKMCFTFGCLAFLICLFTVYNFALDQRRTELIRGSVSANYAYYSASAKIPERNFEIASEAVFRKKEFKYAMLQATGSAIDPRSANMYFQIDGKDYNAYENLPFNCFEIKEGDCFSEYDFIELKQTYKLTSMLSAGTMPENKNEFMISEKMLDAYLLEPKDVLGKEIAVYMKNVLQPDQPILQFTARAVGVIRPEYYELSGHSSSKYYAPQLIFADESDLFQKQSTTYRFEFFEDWPEEDTVQTWAKEFPTYWYAGTTLVHWVKSLNNVQVLASNLYIIIGSALIVGLILTIFLMIDKYIKVFSRSGGILLTLGLRRRRLFALLLLQLLILCLFAVPIALVLTTFGYLVINALVRWATGINMGLSLMRIAGIFGLGVAAVVVIALIFYLYTAVRLCRRSVKQFLMTEVD